MKEPEQLGKRSGVNQHPKICREGNESTKPRIGGRVRPGRSGARVQPREGTGGGTVPPRRHSRGRPRAAGSGAVTLPGRFSAQPARPLLPRPPGRLLRPPGSQCAGAVGGPGGGPRGGGGAGSRRWGRAPGHAAAQHPAPSDRRRVSGHAGVRGREGPRHRRALGPFSSSGSARAPWLRRPLAGELRARGLLSPAARPGSPSGRRPGSSSPRPGPALRSEACGGGPHYGPPRAGLRSRPHFAPGAAGPQDSAAAGKEPGGGGRCVRSPHARDCRRPIVLTRPFSAVPGSNRVQRAVLWHGRGECVWRCILGRRGSFPASHGAFARRLVQPEPGGDGRQGNGDC